MKPLNIIIAATEYPPNTIAGSGRYVLNLISKIKKDHNITIISPIINKELCKEDKSVKVIRLEIPNLPFVDKRMLFSLELNKYLNHLDLSKYDILHVVGSVDASFIDYKRLRNRIRTIISPTDHYGLITSWNPFKSSYFSSDFLFRYFYYNLLKYFTKNALRNCDKILVTCDYMLNLITNLCSIKKDKILVIHRGVDIGKFKVDVKKNKYSSHNVLFVGYNMERKGVIYLINAAIEIIKKVPDVKFTIIGNCSRNYRGKINRFIERQEISKHFEFLDYVNLDDVLKYYRDSNLFVMTPLIETFGQVYAEALVTRTPVIGSDTGGVSEIVNIRNGVLVKPKDIKAISDATISILLDPKRAKEMGINGRKKVLNEYSLEQMVKKTVDVYKELVL